MGWGDATGWMVAFAALVFVAYTVVDVGNQSAPPEPKPAVPAQRESTAVERTAGVVRVVDGDTIIVRTVAVKGGAATGPVQRVRYIGIDTPESVKPDSPTECFGKEAAEANRRLVQGMVVRLVSDKERFDRFGRALAYVYVKGRFVNGELVRNGYATTIEIEPNTSKADELNEFERVAKRTNKGLWAACDR